MYGKINMMNKLLIERINKIIVETQGINDELDLFAYGVTKKIEKKVGKTDVEHSQFGYDYYDGFLNDVFNGSNITVYYTIAYFVNDEEYNAYLNKHGEFHNGFYKMGSKLNIKICLVVVAGKYDYGEFYDSIHHEMEHLFQTKMMGKDFGGDELNAFVKNNIRSNNVYDRILAETIYATRRAEQNAMVNGMWDYVKNKVENGSAFDVDKYIIESEACIWLNKLYENYNFIKNSKENPEFIKAISDYKKFDINYGRLLYITKTGIKRFEEKIALVTRRIKQRIIKEYHVHYDVKPSKILTENAFYCLKIL